MTGSREVQNPAARASSQASLFDLGELFAALWRRRWWVIVPMLLAASLAAAYGIVRPAKYVAHAQILIDPLGLQVVDKDLAPRGITTEAQSALVESQMRVMVSDSVLSEVVRREGLDRDREFIKLPADIISQARRWLGELMGVKRKKLDPARMALDALSKGVGAERPKAAYVINLYVATRDADKSARIANAITQVYSSNEFKSRGRLADRASLSLTKRLGDLRASVQRDESDVEAYKKKNDIVGASGQLVNEQQLSLLNTQLIAQAGLTAKAKARYDEILALKRNKVPTNAIAEAMSSQVLRQLQGRLAAALGEQALLESQFFPAHPRLRQARAKTSGVRRLIAMELDRLATSARLDYARSQADEKLLARRKKVLTDVVLQTNEAQVELRELERKAQASRVVYEAFLVRQRELSEQKSLDNTVARVLTRALPPSSKSGPRLALLLAAGLLGGFGLGAILALLRDQMDQRVYSAKRLRRETQLPVLAQMPRLKGLILSVADLLRARRHKRQGDKNSDSDDIAGGLQLPAALQRDLNGPVGASAVSILNHLGAQALGAQALGAEAYNGAARTVLLCSATGGDTRDADKTEGATGLALALALKAAGDGQNVLLVDGDRGLRRLSQILGREKSDGLVQVLDGAMDAHEVTQPVEDLGLWLMPAGRARPAMGRMPAVGRGASGSAIGGLQLARSQAHDWIIIDGGNIRNAAQRFLVQGADDIVLVVHRGSSDLDRVEEATALLAQGWNNLRGFVIVEREPKIPAPSTDLSSAPSAVGAAAAFTAPAATGQAPPRQTEPTSGKTVTPPRQTAPPLQRRSGSAATAYSSTPGKNGRPARTVTAPRGKKPALVEVAARRSKTGAKIDLGTSTPFAAIPDLTSDGAARRLKQGFEAPSTTSPRASFGDMMAALQSERNGSAQQFRKAIDKLLRKVRKKASRGRPQIVMMVAGHAGAGTSSSALSLAYAASLSGLNCLLVDAYSPDAALSAIFSSELAQERPCVLDSKDHLRELIAKDSGSGLDLLPIALANLNDLKPGQRRKLSAGLAKLADDYDLVVIDGGAVLADGASLDLAACADQVLIVARPGLTLSETIDATGMVLGRAAERIAGVVLARAQNS